jgi:hypothetical protein
MATILSERQQLQYLKEMANAKAKAVEQERLNLEEAKRKEQLKLKRKKAKEKAKAALKASIKAAKDKKRASEKAKKKREKERSALKSSSAKTVKIQKTKNPSKKQLKQQIRIILKSVDLQSMTAKAVRKTLEKLFGCDLKPRKSEVTELLKECINNDESDNDELENVKKSRKRKAKVKAKGRSRSSKKKDTKAPKRNKNAYMFFNSEKRDQVKAENPTASFGEVAQIIGAMWRGMDDKSKKTYEALANKDKKRYDKESSTFNKKK